jgi:hypothetical protein
VIERPEFSAGEREFLAKGLGVIEEHAAFVREGL